MALSRTQVAQVARLAEVDLDGDELVLEVDLPDAGTLDKALQLVELAFARIGAQVGEVDLRRDGGGRKAVRSRGGGAARGRGGV